MNSFVHLHVHSQYSILDGQASISGLVKQAKKMGMPAISLTEHGNMYGAKEFHKAAHKEGIKPILGVEAYVSRTSRHDKNSPTNKSGNHLILLAKNITGYHNLLKMVSYSFTEGFYYKPRIDKELLHQYNEGIICCSACIAGELPRAIRNESYEDAVKVALEFKEIFGDDYYMEIQRHRSGVPGIDDKVYQNQLLVADTIKKISQETGIKIIASNDTHFLTKEDAEAHDILICINTAADYDDPNRMKYTGQEYFKSPAEMYELFKDIPEACLNTLEVAAKIEDYELDRTAIMPVFAIPEEFDTEEKCKARFDEPTLLKEFGEKAFARFGGYDKVLRVKFESDYLRHIVYQGATMRWGDNITDSIRERLDFELATIQNMGFPGYFLIVWDFLKAAREMSISVGPGRGSAAGSAVAYCLRITDIDPIKYNLLFERFLNPDRVSMPDIDIDFDEDGREKILNWVVQKYGQKRVANIITFGTMAPKSAIKDVARVLKLPLSESDRLSKLVPEKPGTSFESAYKESPDLKKERDSGTPLIKKVLELAEKLEGSVRQTGVHACGIIIGRDDLEEHVPLTIAKESSLYVTQFEGKFVEDVGMLKMDFLGLKTLSIIQDAIDNVKKSKGIDIDILNIPIDDELTFKLFAHGDTTGLFQFESDGMKKYLKDLKPNRFEDLIAMNALYRPGPMEYIPKFVARKHGKEPIVYEIAEMEEDLADTYGITVYQEQVMLLSQKIAGFTKGQADSLRKAMGKKIKAMMDDLKGKFIEGALARGHNQKVVEKIWQDWESFAEYAFNKSHSTCYAYVAYQTGYLKAHHPAEFMSAVLTRNISSIDKITLFMDECKRMGMEVLGPDVNESDFNFTVNKKGNIRFGLGGIKGVGEGAVQRIIEERNQNGAYKDIFDFAERVPLQTVNKKNFEALALAGAFDNLGGILRHQLFGMDDKETSFIENLIRYGNRINSDKNSNTTSLFGDSVDMAVVKPNIPQCEEWNTLEKLNKEKEVIGIYLSAHPLDEFKFQIKAFTNTTCADMKDPSKLYGREITIAGLVTEASHLMTKTGKPYGRITIEDYTDSCKITLFSNDYLSFKNYIEKGYSLFIRASFQPKKWGDNPDEKEFKIKSIDLLSNISDQMVKSLCLSIPIEDLNDHIIKDIKELSTDNKGKALLRFIIYDAEENMKLEMFSRSRKINLSSELIKYLERNTEIEYKIN